LDKKQLLQREAHLWIINLDLDERRVAGHYQILSEVEKKRAARFYFERHRRRYIASHGALRQILGAYLDASAEALVFDQSKHGKPALAGAQQDCSIRFNLSHSHEIALLAVTNGVEIGVDVEYMRQMGDIDGIAGRFFSAAEQAVYFELSETLRPQGFFNCWTRKEAFIKAIGEGLSYPLHQFDVSLAPGEPARLLRVKTDPEEAWQWTLDAFHPTPEYTAAATLRQREVQFQQFWFEEED
jgi:4'-phosphopantetheinyl transferase